MNKSAINNVSLSSAHTAVGGTIVAVGTTSFTTTGTSIIITGTSLTGCMLI